MIGFSFLLKKKTSSGNVVVVCSDPAIIDSCTPSRNSAGIWIKKKKNKRIKKLKFYSRVSFR